ncbi:MAG: hypothetical protein Q8R88_14780 [Desulfoprunum sp.]|nr:hypothetical protein [Desulfoprunum sp.]
MRIVIAIFLAVLLSGCVIEKTVSLSSKALAPSKLKEPVSSVTIEAPPIGTEVLLFNDNGKANFRYTLTNDIKPEIEKVIKSVYPVNENSPKKINVKVDIKYFTLFVQGSMSNKINLLMTVKVDVLSAGKIETSDTFMIKEEDEYSTLMLTYPRESNLQSLFEKAYTQLAKEMSEK